jgi:outer membrane protein
VNKAKVDVGQSPPLDLVSAQAEVASDEEQLIVAQTAVKEAEDRLRLLILDTAQRDSWTVNIDTVDSPPVAVAAPDLDAAVGNALRDRADLARARKDIESSQTSLKFTRNQRLPDLRLNASYQASGLGGTQVLRTGGFPGTIVGSGTVTDFGSVLNQLFGRDYPTWTVGLNVSYPIGQSAEEANNARARLENTQAQERLKSAEAHVIQQVRDAGWKIEMNAKRIQTAHAARELADERLDSEQKRLEVGLSTSFLVIQAQRDLAQAKTNELSAVLAYDLALVDFEALQQAGPAASTQPVVTTPTTSPTLQ